MAIDPRHHPLGPAADPVSPAAAPLATAAQGIQPLARTAVNTFAQLNSQYMAPLTAVPVFQAAASTVNPARLELMSHLFGALQGHPMANGATPDQTSPLLNAASGGQDMNTPGWERVAKGIYDNTLGGWIHQAMQNPLAAATEVLVGAGLIVGAGLADAATGGLATPLLWAGFAALVAPHILPGLAQSAMNVWHDPSDQNVSQLLINTGTAAVSFGSPIKAFRGIGAMRSMLEEGAGFVNQAHTPGAVVGDVLKLSDKAKAEGPRVKDIRDLVDPYQGVDQFDVLPQTIDQLEAEINARSHGRAPVDTNDAVVMQLKDLLQFHGQLQRQVRDARIDAHKVSLGEKPYTDEIAKQVSDTRRQLSEFEKSELVPAQKAFAHRYGYLLANEAPMPKMTAEEVAQVGPAARRRIDQRFGAVYGILHGAGVGDGWDGVSDGMHHTDWAASLAESSARDDAAGGIGHGHAEAYAAFLEAATEAGIKPDRWESIYSAIEGGVRDENGVATETHLEGLSPVEKYFTEKLSIAGGIMTSHAYKHGHVEIPMQRYAPRMVQYDVSHQGGQATRWLVEGIQPGSAGIRNRNWVADDWGAANASHDEEFSGQDPDLTPRPLAERMRQAVATRDQFHAKEKAKRAYYEQTNPYRELLKNPKWNALVRSERQKVRDARSAATKARKKMIGQPEQLDGLDQQIKGHEDALGQLRSARGGLARQHGMQAQRDQLDKAIAARAKELRTAQTQRKRLAGQLAGWRASLEREKQAEASLSKSLEDQGKELGAPQRKALGELGGMEAREMRKIASAQPGGRTLLSGPELFSAWMKRYTRQMNQTRGRETVRSLASTKMPEGVKMAYGGDKSITIHEVGTKDLEERPIAWEEQPRDSREQVERNGYELWFPAIGKKDALNYQPALYGRSDVVARYKELAQRARSAKEHDTALHQAAYTVMIGAPKRGIMYSPAWHFKNVFGGFMAEVINDPGMASYAMGRVLWDRFKNPERYYATKLEFWRDGGVPANRHAIHDHINWLEQQLTAQRNFGHAVRTAAGAVPHAYVQHVENGFWKTVDDVATAAHLVKKHQLVNRGMSRGMAGMLAAEYGNNVAGMVNPLYMGKLWKWGRQMAMFAPSWWTTFARMGVQSLPGSARLSHYLAHGELSKRLGGDSLDPVKMHSLDIRHRKELVRMHRSYFLTYMAAGMVSHDLMNLVLAGHHAWDNQPGHEWDLEWDRYIHPTGDPQVDQVRHAHMHSIFFYSRAADAMNAVGIGHDYGFLHQLHTPAYQQADAAHKFGVLAHSLATGARDVAASKTSTAVTEAVGVGGGIDPYALLRNNEVQQVPRTEALLGLLPGGFVAQRVIDQQRRAAERAGIVNDPGAMKRAEDALKAIPGEYSRALAFQTMGLPSLYFTGDEPADGYHFLTEQETLKYLKSREDIHTRKKLLSEQLFNGQTSPYDWMQENEVLTQRYLQLLSDTFGQDSSGGLLFKARRDMYTRYNLDDPKLTRSDRIYASQRMEAEWQQTLDSANPRAKATWWDVHTSQWTDADYLNWLSRQVRDSVMAAIDGEGGNHIRRAQHDLGSGGLPLDPNALDALRQQDPYLWTYNMVMKQLGKQSLLGGLTAAYHNPYANFYVIPPGQEAAVDEADQAGLLRGGSTLVRSQSLRGLAGVGRAEGQPRLDDRGQLLPNQPEAVASGGSLPETPTGQAVGKGLSAEAARTILQEQGESLDPQLAAYLERLAGG